MFFTDIIWRRRNILAISRVENIIWQCFLLQINSARNIFQIWIEIIVASWHMHLVQEMLVSVCDGASPSKTHLDIHIFSVCVCVCVLGM